MIGIFFSIIILEIFLNIYNPFQFRQKGDRIVLPSNFSKVYENKTIEGLDSIVTHTKNSLGFRGLEMPEDFENWVSIITVGGSTTECYWVSDGKDWTYLLGEKLNSQHNKIWINNAGLNGHSTFGHQILLNDYLVNMEPDYLIFLVGANDIGRKDLSEYDKINLRRNTDWKSYLKNNSELISTLINLKRNFNARSKGLGHAGVNFKELESVDSINNNKLLEMIEYHRSFTTEFKNRLKNLVSTSKESKIIPILITQPTLVGEGFDEATNLDLQKVKLCGGSSGKAHWEILELYNNATREVAKDESIHCIDLAHKMPKSIELFYDCFHFTNEGSEVVSQILYDDMQEILKQNYSTN